MFSGPGLSDSARTAWTNWRTGAGAMNAAGLIGSTFAAAEPDVFAATAQTLWRRSATATCGEQQQGWGAGLDAAFARRGESSGPTCPAPTARHERSCDGHETPHRLFDLPARSARRGVARRAMAGRRTSDGRKESGHALSAQEPVAKNRFELAPPAASRACAPLDHRPDSSVGGRLRRRLRRRRHGAGRGGVDDAQRQLREHPRRELGDRLRERGRPERHLDAAAHRLRSLRGFRLHAAHQRGRRRLRAGPRLERHGVRPGDGRAAVEGRVRRADARAERPRPRGRGPLRRDQRRRVRARRRVRGGGLEEAGPRVRLRGRGGPEPRLHDPAGGPGRRPAPVRGRQGRRWACARVRCEDGRAALVLRHHGRAPGRRHGFGRRLEHAARRRRGQRLLLGRERLLLA